MWTILRGSRMLAVGGVGVALTATAWTMAGSAVLAQRSGGAPAAQPAGALPKISVGGVRVTAPGLGESGTELRPFNESPGTSIVVYLTAPAGAGLVDIDDDASTLKSFADDKGQTMLEEGRIGPFPKVSSDGSAGLFEIEVRGRPSAGATSVTAQGTVAVTLANGSKPQRVPSVRLENGRTFKVGTTTITVKEVTSDADSTSVTLGLPRTAMSAIRSLHFLTAAGAAIESHRSGSGYMNDDGEFNYEVKTKDKVVTLEFDLWQNLHSAKVPFSVKVGIALDK